MSIRLQFATPSTLSPAVTTRLPFAVPSTAPAAVSTAPPVASARLQFADCSARLPVASARQQLESLLSSRGFAATLPRFDAQPASAIDDELRALVRDGPPPGAITELVPDEAGAQAQPIENLGERRYIARGAVAGSWTSSHGVTSLALRLLARAQTDTGEGSASFEPQRVPVQGAASCVAWLDPDHALDVLSAEQAGVVLERLLWVRSARASDTWAVDGGLRTVDRKAWAVRRGRSSVVSSSRTKDHGPRTTPSQRAAPSNEIPEFLHAAQLLVHAGGFRVVGLDLRSQPPAALRLIPRAVWFRLLRGVERSRSALLVVAPAPLTTTCSTLTVGVRRASSDWRHDGGGLLAGMSIEARVIASRRLRLADGSSAKKPPAAVGLELRL